VHSLTDSFLTGLSLTAYHASTIRALGEHRGEQDPYQQQAPAKGTGAPAEGFTEKAIQENETSRLGSING